MQMNALRSLNFLKLSSSSSTREAYCVTSMSAGTPAGYFFSQMRSLVLPLLIPRFFKTGHVVSGSIEQCGGQWQAAARYGRVNGPKSRHNSPSFRGASEAREPGIQRNTWASGFRVHAKTRVPE